VNEQDISEAFGKATTVILFLSLLDFVSRFVSGSQVVAVSLRFPIVFQEKERSDLMNVLEFFERFVDGS